MLSNATTYQISETYDAIANGGTYNGGLFYLGLLASDPGKGGSIASEASYTGYARLAMGSAADDQFSAPDGNGLSGNSNELIFAINADATPVTVSYFGIFDAGGTMRYYAPASTIRTYNQYETPHVRVGDIRLQF